MNGIIGQPPLRIMFTSRASFQFPYGVGFERAILKFQIDILFIFQTVRTNAQTKAVKSKGSPQMTPLIHSMLSFHNSP